MTRKPPTPRIVDFTQLESQSHIVGEMADTLGAYYRKIEDKLQSLNLGIEAWVTIESGVGFGYCKHNHHKTKKWGLFIRTDYHTGNPNLVHILDAPRRYRALAVQHVIPLIEELTVEAQMLAVKLKEGVVLVEELVKGLEEE